MSLVKLAKQLCHQFQIKPLRRRGQNFLINPCAIQRFLSFADIKSNDLVLEIGSGLGFLTQVLAQKAKKVIAIEIDHQLVRASKYYLASISSAYLKNGSSLEIIQEDIRDFELEKYHLKDYWVVANLPFNVASLVIRKFLESKNQPKEMILIIQKEVADRMIVSPGKMNLLAVMIQFQAKVKKLGIIKKQDFWPQPKVDSAIIRVIPVQNYCSQINSKDIPDFFNLIKSGFSSPRKYLLNNLFQGGIINKEQGTKIFQALNWNLRFRAQDLSIQNWIDLFFELKIKLKNKIK